MCLIFGVLLYNSADHPYIYNILYIWYILYSIQMIFRIIYVLYNCTVGSYVNLQYDVSIIFQIFKYRYFTEIDWSVVLYITCTCTYDSTKSNPCRVGSGRAMIRNETSLLFTILYLGLQITFLTSCVNVLSVRVSEIGVVLVRNR